MNWLAQQFLRVCAQAMIATGHGYRRTCQKFSGAGKDRRHDKFEEPNKHLRAYHKRYGG